MVRVVIADDHLLVRAGIKNLLEACGSIEVVGEASTAGEAIEQIRDSSPDVVVLDLSMPEGGGLEVLRHLPSACSSTRALVLTGHTNPDYIQFSVRAGAHGFVGKNAVTEQLIDAILAVAKGGTHFPIRLEDGLSDLLTEREFQVLPLLARGLNNRAIAASLGVRVKTVDTHRYKILKKLGVGTTAELTRMAIRRGWIDP